MSIESISFIPAGTGLHEITGATAVQQPGVEQSGNFSQWFESQLVELNNQINSSDTKLEKMATGESNNLHDVMMSLEKAKLSFQLTLQVRNKLLEGYQEIMRMQV